MLEILSTLTSFISFYSLLPVVLGLIVGYIFIEQFWIWRVAQNLPGPKFVIPFFGSVFQMVYDPFGFWDNQDKLGPLSWNSLVGNFMLFTRDSKLSTTIFKNAANNNFQVCLNLNGERLLGKGNIAFMQGEAHKTLRQQVLYLFTKKALAKYVSVQEECIRRAFDNWFIEAKKSGGKVEMRPLIRDLNLETSQTVFVGPYLEPSKRKQFCDDYMLMNDGLLCLPWAFPGSALWRAIRARKRIVAMLAEFAAKSKVAMRKAKEEGTVQPECLLDFWMWDTNDRLDAWEKAKKESDDPESVPRPPHTLDEEIGHTVLDFLFASQDASSASLTWVCHFLSKHPDILERVRAEQKEVRPTDEPLDLNTLNKMPFTRQVIREVLRIRAPATLVPHVALDNFKLNDDVIIPKGTLVCPSVYSSSFQGFTDPHTFDPDRFSPERKEDVKFKGNFLVFGAGPHKCLGYEYAMLHLLAFTSLFTTHVDFERVWTKDSEGIVYGPTIYPADGCILNIQRKPVVAAN